jgi:ankyrin repeat protein
MKHGADVSVTDLDGNTPMHIAILEAREGVVEMLLRRGVDWGRSQRNRRELGIWRLR